MIEMTDADYEETIKKLQEDKNTLNRLVNEANVKLAEARDNIKERDERIRGLESTIVWYAEREMQREKNSGSGVKSTAQQ